MNILESAQELNEKQISFTPDAKKELESLCSAVSEILTLSYNAYVGGDLEAASRIEPLEQVIDDLKDKLRDSHIRRLKKQDCTIEAGFVWIDLLTNLERTADHCSNIGLCALDTAQNNMNVHQSQATMTRNNPVFEAQYAHYSKKYRV